MSYTTVGGFGAAADCGPGEFFDEPSGECLCNPGLTPSPVVGGGCIAVKSGGTTGDNCLMQGMDYDIASQKCIPRCPSGQGHDVNGNCVSLVAWDTEHGITPGGGGGGGGGAPAAESPDAIAKASFPWVAGAAIGVVLIALIAAATGKKAPAQGSRSSGGQRYAANRKAKARRAAAKKRFARGSPPRRYSQYYLVRYYDGKAQEYFGPYPKNADAAAKRRADIKKYGRVRGMRYSITGRKPW